MAQTVREVMTADPVTVESGETVAEAARRMRTADAGALVVLDNGRVTGILTDRDIAIRAVAEDRDVRSTIVGEVASEAVETLGPDASVEQAVQTMRSRSVRRLPVVENDRAVGIVSLGDLAMERDPGSALADVSAAPGNQ